jgi:uncharacterized membrane protein YkgB
MVDEFRRYGLEKYRSITGILQILAACGMLIGIVYPWAGGLAASGITLQMACGLGVRIKIGDPWYQCFPAATYMLLCGWLALRIL